MNRNERQTQPANVGQPGGGVGSTPAGGDGNRNRGGKSAGLGVGKMVSVVLLFAVTILLVALIWFMIIGGDKDSNGGATTGAQELQHVDTGKMQAVFLNGGQVYFGKIKNLNSQYMKLDSIYYLRVNQQVQPDRNSGQAAQNDISLVKLGCELHGPTDEMVVNREQVIFWENLKDDGQVAQAVKEYEKQNPEGQKCEQPSDATNQNNPNNNTNEQPVTP